MELRYVIPNMEKTFGNLEFGGKVDARRGDTTRQGSRVITHYRRYKLFSDVQRADDIVLVKPEPASAPNSGQPAQPRRENQPDKKA